MRTNANASRAGQKNNRHGARVIAHDVTKTFQTTDGPVTACQMIDLEVQPGEFMVIVGPSGCGKSTLLRMIADLETPTSGTIRTSADDNSVPTNSMVFHGRTLFPWLSLRSNVAYGLQMQGESKRRSLEKADQLLELLKPYED